MPTWLISLLPHITPLWLTLPHVAGIYTLPSCHATEIVSHARYREYLAFDPMVSSHHLVFRIPYLRAPWGVACDPLEEESEWPPSLYKLDVFSSRTSRWEDRLFVRQGDAAGTVGKTRRRIGYSSDKESLE